MLKNTSKRHPTTHPWKLGTKTISFIAVFFLLLYSAYKIKDIYQFPITEVKVFGANHIDHQAVQQLLMPLIANGFFATEVNTIKDRLEQLPWVADATVRRVWPNEVLIAIRERAAVARWNNDGLLSANGEIFIPDANSYPAELPQFIGAEGQQIAMLEFYEKINRLFAPLHFKIARVELTDDAWDFAFENGIKLTAGRKDVLTHLIHFVKVYPKIVGTHEKDVDYIDLRYANGLAVKWKSTTIVT